MPVSEGHIRRPAQFAARVILAGVIGLSLAFSSTLASLPAAPAHAAAIEQSPSANAAVIGLWAAHPYPDHPAAQELVAFTSDGLMLATNAPSMPSDPSEGPTGATHDFGSQGYGVWTAQADHSFAFKFLSITYDADGNYLNTISIHGSVTCDATGNAFTGSYVVTLMLPDGTSMDLQGSTPVNGSRVTTTLIPEGTA